MINLTLPPELECFATEAVAAGVSLLQRQEKARAELPASVLVAEEEADRDGYFTADEMIARVEARLAQRASAKA